METKKKADFVFLMAALWAASCNRRGLWWPFCGFWVCSGSGSEGFSQPPYPDLYFQCFLCFSSFCNFSYFMCYGNIFI